MALILTDLSVRNFGEMSYFLGLVGFFLGETFIYDLLFVWPREMLIRNRSYFNDLKEDYESKLLPTDSVNEYIPRFKDTIADVINILEANRDFVEWRIRGLERLIYSNLPLLINIKVYSKYLKLNNRLLKIKFQIKELEDESDSVSTFLLSKDNPYK
jgi:hypothetical protein